MMASALALAGAGQSLHTAMAWTPLLQPMPIDAYWMVLLLPLVAAISIVYRAIKLDDLRQLPRQATALALQIVAFMALGAAALWLLTELV